MSATTVGTPDGPVAPDGVPTPEGFSPTAAVASGLAVHGLDLRTARSVVEARAVRRVRRRRGVLAGVGVLAVLALGLLLIPGDEEPDDVIADSDTTTSTSVTTTTLPPETVPLITAPPTTVAASTTTIRPVTTVPPTAAPTTAAPTANQPMSISVQGGGAKRVGETVELLVNWSDADADPANVRATAVWGDPNVGLPLVAGSGASCDLPGPGGSGTIPLKFRYSAANTYRVQVEVSACDGQGPFGERQTLTSDVKVDPVDGSRGVVLVGEPSPRVLDDGELWAPTTTPTKRDPALGQVSLFDVQGLPAGSPATVVVVPSSYSGEVILKWADGCQRSTVAAGTDTLPSRLGVLSQTCPAQPTGAGISATSSTVP